MKPHSIHFLPQDQHIAFRLEESVLEVALRNGIPLPHSCGGMGTCTTCRVFVESPGPLAERGEVEREIAEPRGFANNERLACQLPPSENLVVRIPETLDGDKEST